MKKKMKILIMCLIVFVSLCSVVLGVTIDQGTPILNSTLKKNSTAENLTVYNVSTNGTNVKNIISWYVNGRPLQIVNFPFEGGSNATDINSSGGYLMIGKVNSAIYNQTGGFDGNGSYYFAGNGSDQYINVTSAQTEPFFDLVNNFSITFWVRPRDNDTENSQVLLEKAGSWNLRIQSNSTGNPALQYQLVFTTSGVKDYDSNFILVQDTWTHVGIVMNSTNSTLFYFDGVLYAVDNATGGATLNNNLVFMGSDRGLVGNSGLYFNGSLDELVVWNRSLSAQEIKALYQNQSNIMVSQELKFNDTWVANMTAINNTDLGLIKLSNPLTIDVVPTIDIPVFNVSTITKTSGIKANTTYKDEEGINGTIFFRWFRNNTEVFTDNYTSITNFTIVNSTLNVSFYNRSDLVNVTVYANDSIMNSEINFSTTLTVQNTIPTIEQPNFNVTFPTKTTGLKANTTYRDADVDGGIIYFRWLRNNTEVFTDNYTSIASGTIVNSSLSVALYSRGDIVNVTVIGSDATSNSSTNFSTVTINNTAPKVETLVFNVTSVTKTSGIRTNTTYTDTDADGGTIYVRWFRNNSEIFTENFTGQVNGTIIISNLSVNLYNRTDLLNATAYASDGNLNSTTNFSTTLTVQNTAPTIGDPVFNVTTVTKTSGIRANTTYKDVDRDGGSLYFRWFRNNTEIFTENFTSQAVDTIIISNLSVNLYNRTDLLNVTVYANDGTANSATANTSTLTVANTAPSAETPVFNVSTVTKTSGIRANTTYRDADRDNGRITFRWFRNATEIFTENFTAQVVDTIIISNLSVNFYNRTDLLNVTVFADDGNVNSSTNFSATLTVGNTVPKQGAPILNSTFASNNTDENLTVYNISTSDVDNDGIKNIVNWYVNDVSLQIVNIPFEGGSNNSYTRDYSGFNMSFPVDAVWNSTGGYDGKGSYYFGGNGSFQYMNITNITADESRFDFVNNFSITMWFRPHRSNYELNQSLMSKTTSWDLRINDNLSGAMQREIVFESVGVKVYDSNYDPADNTWTHLGIVMNTTNSTLFYINGALFAVDNATSGITLGNAFVRVASFNPFSATVGGFFNGSIDDVAVWNRSLSAQEIKALYDNRSNIFVSQNISQSLISGEKWNASITPNDGNGDGPTNYTSSVSINYLNITLFTPENNSAQNTVNITHNFNVTAEVSGCQLWNNDTSATFTNRTGAITVGKDNNNTANRTSIPELLGIAWNIQCTTKGGTSFFAPANFTLAIDRTLPVLTFFKPTRSNVTVYPQQNISINVSCTDNNDLFAVQHNITNATNQSIYLNLTNNLVGKSYNPMIYVNFSNNATGRFQDYVQCADDHTAVEIPDYNPGEDISAKEISFNTPEGTRQIKLISSSVALRGLVTSEYPDRVSFGFEFEEPKIARVQSTISMTFEVISDDPIYQRINSEYKGHFVTTNDGVHGQWIDFENNESDIVTTRQSGGKWFVDVVTTEYNVTFNSIGGLNTAEENVTFYTSTLTNITNQERVNITTRIPFSISTANDTNLAHAYLFVLYSSNVGDSDVVAPAYPGFNTECTSTANTTVCAIPINITLPPFAVRRETR